MEGAGTRKRSSTSAGVLIGVSKPGGQTEVYADRRGIIAPTVCCYLAPYEVIEEDMS